MAGSDMVVTSGNDFSSERGFSWNVDSPVIVKESVLLGDASVMSERVGDASVPELFLSGSFFNVLVGQVGGWHDEGSEMRWLKDDDVAVILLPLVVVVTSGQKVCLFVKDAGLVS